MSQACPTCAKPVDPLRARSVGVRDGKVVAYCSLDCARAAESRPTAIPSTLASLDSGPVIEIVREPVSAPVPVASRARGTSRGRPHAKAASAGQRAAATTAPERAAPPEPTHQAAPTPRVEPTLRAEPTDRGGTEPVRGRRRAPLTIAVVVALGGAGAVLAYRFLISHRDVAASTPRTAAPPATATTPERDLASPGGVRAPAAAPTPAAAVTAARQVLTANLVGSTPRVQRVAAAALARTGDPAAIAALVAALAEERTDVARLDLAYALARAGDRRGFDVLVAGLRSTRRDARIQAGRQLALLGDQRAIPSLAAFLGVSQLRLGAAEQLAHLAEPRAIAALDQIRAAADSSPDDKARATIALGVAGRVDMIPELHALLADARFNAFAAAALAGHQDAAARPVLVEQLAIPSLRVDAARSLRRLDLALDPAPYLPALLAALAGDKDTEQVHVAEAILLLAGEPAWADRP